MGHRIRLALLAATAVTAAACTTTVYEPAPEAASEPGPAAAATPADSGEVSFFYGSLAPYGSWLTVAGYGQVWLPRVNPWWRPYTEGRWVYTNSGWTWDSSEPFGWATFHYGRWLDDPQVGWVWVPGTVWGPAWVAWRSGGGHIGWAPLPPSARWEVGVGFSGGGNFAAVIAPAHWCFVEDRYMTAPAIREYVAPRARNVTYVNVTNNITNYTVIHDRIVDRSVDVRQVERVTHQRVPMYNIVDQASPADLNGRGLRAHDLPMVRHVPALETGATGHTQTVGPAVTGAVHREPFASTPVTPAAGREAYGVRMTTSTTQPTTTHVESVTEINRRYRAERQALAAHQAEQTLRLQHERGTVTPVTTAKVQLERTNYLAEQRALAQEHKREATILANRHKLELEQARHSKPAVERKKAPPPKRPVREHPNQN